MLTHIYGTQKDGTDELICRAGTETQSEVRLVVTVGEEEGETNTE